MVTWKCDCGKEVQYSISTNLLPGEFGYQPDGFRCDDCRKAYWDGYWLAQQKWEAEHFPICLKIQGNPLHGSRVYSGKEALEILNTLLKLQSSSPILDSAPLVLHSLVEDKPPAD